MVSFLHQVFQPVPEIDRQLIFRFKINLARFRVHNSSAVCILIGEWFCHFFVREYPNFHIRIRNESPIIISVMRNRKTIGSQPVDAEGRIGIVMDYCVLSNIKHTEMFKIPVNFLVNVCHFLLR